MSNPIEWYLLILAIALGIVALVLLLWCIKRMARPKSKGRSRTEQITNIIVAGLSLAALVMSIVWAGSFTG